MALLDDDSPHECKICFNEFDEDERRPRNLPCGHTFCTPCIAATFRTNWFACPSCRAQHVALDVTAFPISYITEAFMRLVRKAGPRHGLVGRRRLQEEEVRLRKLMYGCQETQTHLDHCLVELARGGGARGPPREGAGMATRLEAISEHNKRVLQRVHEQHRRVASRLGDSSDSGHLLHPRLDLTLDVEPCGGGGAVGERPISPRDHSADPYSPGDRFRLPRLRDQNDNGNPGVRRADGHLWDQSVTKYKRGARGRSGVVAMVQESSGVYAVDEQTTPAPPMSAKLSLCDEKLYVHVLHDQAVPPYARILKHGEAMRLADPFYSVVFLEFGWGGVSRGRVHIRLTPYDRRGQHFLALCTGQGGRSYVATQLLQVGYKGRPGEYVVGGGLDDCSLEDDELGRECQKRASVGLVWGWCDGDGGHGGANGSGASGTRYAITTKHPGPGTSYCRVFGKVETGLDVLKAATKLKDITEVTVVDCGLVVSF